MTDRISMPLDSTVLRLLLALALLLPPPAARAQDDPAIAGDALAGRDWAGHFAVLSANAALGGVAAGVVQKLRGGSFQDGFARGALGGGIAYAGKRLAVQRFDGAGLLGRQVAAVGGSVVANAAAARPSLERLVLPLGFVRLRIAPGSAHPVRASLDVHGAIWTLYAAARPELRLDLGASLSAGAPVFRSPGYSIGWEETGERAEGFAPAGVILLSDPDWGEFSDASVFAHERVHVLQYDQALAAMSDPLQAWLAPRLPGGRAVSRWLDLDLTAPFLFLVTRSPSGYEARPWEREAYYLVGR